MYKRILAQVLGETIVKQHRRSESFAIDLGRQILRGNVDSIFFDQE
jgi:hypothetical protein